MDAGSSCFGHAAIYQIMRVVPLWRWISFSLFAQQSVRVNAKIRFWEKRAYSQGLRDRIKPSVKLHCHIWHHVCVCLSCLSPVLQLEISKSFTTYASVAMVTRSNKQVYGSCGSLVVTFDFASPMCQFSFWCHVIKVKSFHNTAQYFKISFQLLCSVGERAIQSSLYANKAVGKYSDRGLCVSDFIKDSFLVSLLAFHWPSFYM